MAFYEFRKFVFFDLKKDVDGGNVASALKENGVTVATSGNSQLIFGDSTGQLHLVSRTWNVKTFRGYELKVLLAQQLQHSPLLVTIGEDEPGINPILKVWDTNKLDRNGFPTCVRITRTIPQNRPVEACALCVHHGMQLMAVGFVDGTVILYRGDITRDRSSRQKVLKDNASSPITGLNFKTTSSATLLFVATTTSTFLYNISSHHKDKEHKISLDSSGCTNKCCVLAESFQDGHFMVARDKAVFCYTADGRGPCYAIDSEKIMIEWFRSYLVIISKNSSSSESEVPPEKHMIVVLDLQNKFIVFSSPMQEVKAILSEWGSFYILDGNNNICHLDEKDLQSKLILLFKKNLYDIAIRIAKLQQYDSDGLIDIFRQFGDHLYTKGDAAGAVEQYIKTIGKLEASYVIRKFLDSQYIKMLIKYLQALHKQGHATEDHTTLLLNCYKKEDKTEELKEFIMTKDRELDFDVEIAIKVCRQVSSTEALTLAMKHGKHDWYLKIQIEDHKNYKDALDYIANLEFIDAEFYMKKYGDVIIQNVPEESTQFLMKLCSNYKPMSKSSNDENFIDGIDCFTQKSDPENFIHLFLNNSVQLVEFLEYLVNKGQILSTAVYDTLLEHYLHVWKSLDKQKSYEEHIIKFLQNPNMKYDKHQALVVCHMHEFSSGILHLYRDQNLYQCILSYQLSKENVPVALNFCEIFNKQEPNLWLQALWAYIKNPHISLHDLPRVLTNIANNRLLSPLLVIDALGSSTAGVTLEHVRDYIISEFQREEQLTQENMKTIKKSELNIVEAREKVHTLRTGIVKFQGTRCVTCHHPLELPSLHFFCQHSYHQHCFQSFSDGNECPVCLKENKSVIDRLKSTEDQKGLHEDFHSSLEKAEDGFSLAASYFKRRVFNKVTIVTEHSLQQSYLKDQLVKLPTEQSDQVADPFLNFNPSEGRLRQLEGKNQTSIIPVPEGRMRMQESQYNTSLEANLTKVSPKSMSKESPRAADSLSSYLLNSSVSKSAIYDERNNPFMEEENNPFKVDVDDYDKNLNPFFE